MNTDIWTFIQDHLEANEKVILMVVMDVRGSSPGRTGFKMSVAGNNEILGSIGGGVMEYNMVEAARAMIAENKHETIIKRQVHQPDTLIDKSGLICAGEQTQAIIPLTTSDLNTVRKIKECLNNGEKGILRISPGEFIFSQDVTSDGSLPLFINKDDYWEFSEEIGPAETVYIFGAGHISLPLCQILRMLDFRIVVFDDREGLSTFTANKAAHKKQVIEYNKISDLIADEGSNYAAIMSFAHKSDKLILSQLIPKKLKYLGMIGSKSKVQKIYDSLREEGFTDDDFARVDSPIGISINSQTPAEIAVSIAAKIIQVRNTK